MQGHVSGNHCSGAFRFRRGPDARHEMRCGVDLAESGIDQTLIDVVADEIAVIGLMEHPSEILHRDIELG